MDNLEGDASSSAGGKSGSDSTKGTKRARPVQSREEYLEKRRCLNRINARKSRLRKTFMYETLKQQWDLCVKQALHLRELAQKNLDETIEDILGKPPVTLDDPADEQTVEKDVESELKKLSADSTSGQESDQKDRKRDINKINAKKSRLRKKAQMQGIEARLETIKGENETLCKMLSKKLKQPESSIMNTKAVNTVVQRMQNALQSRLTAEDVRAKKERHESRQTLLEKSEGSRGEQDSVKYEQASQHGSQITMNGTGMASSGVTQQGRYVVFVGNQQNVPHLQFQGVPQQIIRLDANQVAYGTQFVTTNNGQNVIQTYQPYQNQQGQQVQYVSQNQQQFVPQSNQQQFVQQQNVQQQHAPQPSNAQNVTSMRGQTASYEPQQQQQVYRVVSHDSEQILKNSQVTMQQQMTSQHHQNGQAQQQQPIQYSSQLPLQFVNGSGQVQSSNQQAQQYQILNAQHPNNNNVQFPQQRSNGQFMSIEQQNQQQQALHYTSQQCGQTVVSPPNLTARNTDTTTHDALMQQDILRRTENWTVRMTKTVPANLDGSYQSNSVSNNDSGNKKDGSVQSSSSSIEAPSPASRSPQNFTPTSMSVNSNNDESRSDPGNACDASSSRDSPTLDSSDSSSTKASTKPGQRSNSRYDVSGTNSDGSKSSSTLPQSSASTKLGSSNASSASRTSDTSSTSGDDKKPRMKNQIAKVLHKLQQHQNSREAPQCMACMKHPPTHSITVRLCGHCFKELDLEENSNQSHSTNAKPQQLSSECFQQQNLKPEVVNQAISQ